MKRGLIVFSVLGLAVGGYILYHRYKKNQFKDDCIDRGGNLINDFTCDLLDGTALTK
jgi:hypothetical protein